MEKGGATYIMTNKTKTVLYVGATSDLLARVTQHKNHYFKNSFTDRYNVEYLIWYDTFHTIDEALAFEKKIKGWKRIKKIDLINLKNPGWIDLWDEISNW
jgi:putative endonuclease